jgi:hypothetical protein
MLMFHNAFSVGRLRKREVDPKRAGELLQFNLPKVVPVRSSFSRNNAWADIQNLYEV